MNQWISDVCRGCEQTNWLDMGDPNDLTGHDPVACCCHNCGHSWWLGGEIPSWIASLDREVDPSDKADEGQEFPI